jgi:hypothetical protein
LFEWTRNVFFPQIGKKQYNSRGSLYEKFRGLIKYIEEEEEEEEDNIWLEG